MSLCLSLPICKVSYSEDQVSDGGDAQDTPAFTRDGGRHVLAGQWAIPTGHGCYGWALSTWSPFKVSPLSFGPRNTRTLAQPSDVTLVIAHLELRSPTLSQTMSMFQN